MGAGRPTQYRAAYAKKAAKLCELGATDKELAEFFEVSEQTINTWKQKHPKFLESIRRAKDEADRKVERALFERATGYAHLDTKFATFEGRITDSCEYTKHYPPDYNAMRLWLLNRKPEVWRDKQEHEHSGRVSFTPVLEIAQDDPE